MRTETMTVHQALCEIKTAEKKFDRVLNDLDAVEPNKATAKKVAGVDIEAFEKAAKAHFQSAIDLLARYEAMKAAVSQYNASTTIIVAGREYTIAQAIFLNNFADSWKRALILRLNTQYENARGKALAANGDKLDRAAEAAAAAMFGAKEKSSSADYMEFIESFKKNNQVVLIDPLGAMTQAKKLQDEVDAFEAGVDAAIQVANATHEITINY